MAGGRVVVASKKCGGAIDLIDEGVNGYIIETGPESLVRVLKRINNDKSNLNRMKDASFRKIKRFSYNTIVTALTSVLEEGIKK
jgi:glycosyltransferase involved in cell wall biosynthesis